MKSTILETKLLPQPIGQKNKRQNTIKPTVKSLIYEEIDFCTLV